MQLTKGVEYGIEGILYLARRDRGEPALIREISRATAIPGNKCPPVPPPAMITFINPNSGPVGFRIPVLIDRVRGNHPACEDERGGVVSPNYSSRTINYNNAIDDASCPVGIRYR